MGRILLAIIFIFALIGCGGGSSGSSFVKITQSNLDTILATYKKVLDVSAINIILFTSKPGEYSDSNGIHTCPSGGSYKVTTKSSQKEFIYKECIKDNTKYSGTILMNSNSKSEFEEFLINYANTTEIKIDGNSNINKSSYFIMSLNSLNYKKGNFVLEAKNYSYTIKKITNSMLNTTLTTLVKSSKINAQVKIDTLTPLEQSGINMCPTGGASKVIGDNSSVNIAYSSSMNIDIYLNNSNSILKSYNSCNDLPN